MGVIDMKLNLADMRDQLNPVDDDSRKQESHDGKCADADQEDINGSGYALATTAVATIRQMLLVVGAHRRRETRDVVTPTREDVADYLINAGTGALAAIGK